MSTRRLIRPGDPSRRVNGDGRRRLGCAVEQPDVGERQPCVSRRDRLVLRREGVDRGCDHVHLRRIGPRRREGGPRGDDRIGVGQVGTQEIPGTLAPFVGTVEADVAAPNDPRTGVLGSRDEARGLRVVDDDDVIRAHEARSSSALAPRIVLVVPSLRRHRGRRRRPASRKAVVDPLRDCEERGIALDHQPARVDARAAGVGEQRLQHLGDAAAARGRVDVQHRATGKRLARSCRGLLEPRHPLRADQRLEPRGVDRMDVHFVELGVVADAHAAPPASLDGSP